MKTPSINYFFPATSHSKAAFLESLPLTNNDLNKTKNNQLVNTTQSNSVPCDLSPIEYHAGLFSQHKRVARRLATHGCIINQAATPKLFTMSSDDDKSAASINPTGTALSLSADRKNALAKLLMSLFSSEELRRLIEDNYVEIFPNLPNSRSSMFKLSNDTINLMSDNDLITLDIFRLLLEIRPGRDKDIKELLNNWKKDQERAIS